MQEKPDPIDEFKDAPDDPKPTIDPALIPQIQEIARKVAKEEIGKALGYHVE